MDALAEVFDHHPSYRILVCRTCAFAVPPKHIITHIQKRHSRVSVTQRDAIAKAAQGLSDLAWNREDLALPIVAEARLPGLQDGIDGRVCQSEGCGYTCTTKQGITTHCRDQHGWVNTQKRGGDARKKSSEPVNRMWADDQPYQRVFRASGWPAFVAVRTATTQHSEVDLYEQVKAERKRIEDEEAAAAAQDTIKEGRRQLPNPWLELTGWPAHLKGRSRTALLDARIPPAKPVEYPRPTTQGEDAVGLARVCHAMRRIISRAFKTARPEVVGRSALEVVERRETGAESNEKPFYSHQKANTISRYSEKVTGILCYLWRTSGDVQPPYSLSANQEAYMDTIKCLALPPNGGNLKELETACLRFWMSLLDHSLGDDEYKSALLSGTVVLGLKPDHLGGGWYPAHEFSPVLSALITTSKALTVYAAYQEWVDTLTELDEKPSVYELVRDKAERFLQLSSYQGIVSPMNRLLRLRTLARSLAKQRNTSGQVSWDGDRILVDRQSFTMVDLQSMIKGLCETARQSLLTDILLLDIAEDGRARIGSAVLPPLSMEQLVDQPAELSAGFSFLKHPDNHFDAWEDWLLRRVTTEPMLKRRFRTGANNDQWCDAAVHAYMKNVRRWKEALFALVHLSAGAPARGTEITSILCENDASGDGYRGIFVESGMVAFVTTYHKGYSFSKNVKTIHRYVPREVSELVVYFLALARPFIIDLQKMHGGVTGSTAFIWEPPPEYDSGESDSEHDNAESEDEERNVEEGSNESEADEEHPRNTQAERPQSANPDGYWGTDRIRRVLREYTSRFMGAALGTRSWRQSYPAIHRNLGTDNKARDVVEMLYWNKELVTNDARALQSGHTVRTEESGYGRLLMESPHQTHREREQFRGVSVDWHRLLGFSSAWQGKHTHPSQTAAMISRQEERAMVRWTALASADLKAEFRALMNKPDAEFRSKQEESLAAIVQRRLRMLVVMATGAGKSILFLLPAAIASTGITVVIVPLNALRDDLLDRCERMGVKAAKWDGRRPPYWASIVLVTPEAAVSPSFGRYIDEKRMMRELDRIVVDECHVLMESSETWRPDVLKLTQMTEKGTQVIYLTATLPPMLQSTFLQLAGLDERTLTVCRDPRTTRPNIAYEVVDYPRADMEETLTRLVAQKRRQFGEDAQIIVYCRQVRQTQSLARVLNCVAYYREMGAEEDKTRLVRAFAMGTVKLCTATNMLGLGLDAAGVRVVIHVDMCFQLRQYVQESGRAGRSGQRSEAIVMNATWRTKTGETRWSTSSKLDAPARAFLTSTQCRRIAIDEHMDGREDRQQCEESEAMCDLCSNRLHGTKRSRTPTTGGGGGLGAGERAAHRKVEIADPREQQKFETAVAREQRQLDIQHQQHAQQRVHELEQLRSHLSRWSGMCVLCMAGTCVCQDHAWQNCPVHTRVIAYTTSVVKAFANVTWQPYARCNSCSAPQAICNRWAERDIRGLFDDRGADLCQYQGVLLPAVAALFVTNMELVKDWVRPLLAQAELPTRPVQLQNLAYVLSRKIRLGQSDASQMAAFFYAWEEGLVRPAAGRREAPSR